MKHRFLVILGLLVLGEIVLTCYIPHLRTQLFNLLERKDILAFWPFLGVYMTFNIGIAAVQGFKYYVSMAASIPFRDIITKRIMKKWSKETLKDITAPQRIETDSKLSTSLFIATGTEVVISSGIVIFLILSIWGQWLLLSTAVLYSSIVLGITYFFGDPLKRRDMDSQQKDAIYRGNLAQNAGTGKFDYTVAKEYFMRYQTLLLGFNLSRSFFGALGYLIPLLFLVPEFFHGHITFGALMGKQVAFELIFVNLTIILQIFEKFNAAQAAQSRLKELEDSLSKISNRIR